MSDLIRITLPRGDSTEGSEQSVEFNEKDFPRTAHDISELIHSYSAIRGISESDLSDGAIFVRRINADIDDFCVQKNISPPLTLSELSAIVQFKDTGVRERKKELRDVMSQLYQFLADKYEFKLDDISITPATVPQEGKAVLTTGEVHGKITKALGSFWKKAYLAILRKEYRDFLPTRMRHRLSTIAMESDPQLRDERILKLTHQIASFPPYKFPIAIRTLYEAMYEPIKGRILTRNERIEMYSKMASLRPTKSLHPDVARQRMVDKLLSDDGLLSSITVFNRSDVNDRKKALRLVKNLMNGYESIIKEPLLFIDPGRQETFSSDEIVKKVSSFAPLQRRLFSAVISERWLDGDPVNQDLCGQLERLIGRFDRGLNDSELQQWAEEMATVLNDLATYPIPIPKPVQPEETVLDDSVEDDEETTEDEPIQDEPDTDFQQERRHTLRSAEDVVNALKIKRANLKFILRSILRLDQRNRFQVFKKVYEFVIEGYEDVPLQKRVGVTLREQDIRHVRSFIESQGEARGTNAKRAWSILITLANKSGNFRRFA